MGTWQATVVGTTSDGGTSSELAVEGFAVTNVGQLRAHFGKLSASILSIKNLINSAVVRVVIPPSNLPGSVEVGLELIKGGIPARETERSSFTYYVPAAAVTSVKWCPVCFQGKACIMNGKCGDGSSPLEGRTPIAGQGIITVYVDNLPVILHDPFTGTPSPSFSTSTFGFGSVFKRVVFSHKVQTAMEFSVPTLLVPAEKDHVLRFTDASTGGAPL